MKLKRKMIVYCTVVVAIFIIVPLAVLYSDSSTGRKSVYHLELNAQVDNVLAAYVKRGVEEAEKAGADLLLVEIDTPGGTVDAAWKISNTLMKAYQKGKIYTVAWVNTNAASAGAMITYSCKDIVMAPGAAFGAVVPIFISPVGEEPKEVREKYTSYLESQMRSIAESMGHDPDYAAAMVRAEIEITYAEKGFASDESSPSSESTGPAMRRTIGEGTSAPERGKYIIRKGNILTFNTEQALFLKVAIGKASSIDELFEIDKLKEYADAKIVRVSRSWSEAFAKFLSHPLVSLLLLIGGIMGISTELKVPGFGAPGILGITCIALFFFANFAAGAAKWTDLIIFLAGMALLGVEIFVIPGFGIVGILGILCIIVSIFMMLTKNPPPGLPQLSGEIFRVLKNLSISLVAGAVAVVVIFRFILPKTPMLGSLILGQTQKSQMGYNVAETDTANLQVLIGKVGVSKTKLRPAGKAIFDGKLFDVVTEGDMIEQGASIRIIEVRGNRVVVKRVEEQ